MVVKEYFLDNSIILIVVPKEQYLAKTIEILKDLESSMEKICYVCLTQPYSTLSDFFKKNNISESKFRFVDVMTNTVQDAKSTQDCAFVSGPSALTEIGVAFSKMSENTNASLIDSITTLLVYENENSVIRFTHSLMTKTRLLSMKAVFIALKEDTNTNLIKDIHMFSDKVIYLSSVESQISEIMAGEKR